MLPETQARLFLSDQRMAMQSPFAHHFHTFSPGSRTSGFGALRRLSDDRLKPEISMLVEAEEDGSILLIPWIGDIALSDPQRDVHFLEEGQLHVFPVCKGDFYELRNPYRDTAINFFQFRFSGEFSQPETVRPIELEKTHNHLVPLYIGKQILSIGAFDGRAEGEYLVKSSTSSLFVFAIEGAFEVQNRLLQPRDALALWNVERIEFEALSQGAVLLVVEMRE